MLGQSPLLDVERMARMFKMCDALGRASGAIEDNLYVRYRLEVFAADVAKCAVDRLARQQLVGNIDYRKGVWRAYVDKDWVNHDVPITKASDMLTLDEIIDSRSGVRYVLQFFDQEWKVKDSRMNPFRLMFLGNRSSEGVVEEKAIAPVHTGYLEIEKGADETHAGEADNPTRQQLIQLGAEALEKHEEVTGLADFSDEFLDAIADMNVDKADLLMKGMGQKIHRKLRTETNS
eukprot:g3098.t1